MIPWKSKRAGTALNSTCGARSEAACGARSRTALEDNARKWMWRSLAVLVALQIYYVRELLAVLFLFAIVFAPLAALAVVAVVVQRAGSVSLSWAAPRPRAAVAFTRRGFAVVTEYSRKPFGRPRSEPAQ